MNTTIIKVIGTAIPMLLISCKSEDLSARDKQQIEELAQLSAEEADIERSLGSMPVNLDQELAKLELEAEVKQEEVAELQGAITELEEKKRQLAEEFEAYKRTHPVSK